MIVTDENGKKWEVDKKDLKEAKPKKAVDLAYLIESGIDCQFTDSTFGGVSVINKLYDFTNDDDGEYNAHSHEGKYSWLYCRPRMNHWNYWRSNLAPLPKGFIIEAHLRNGTSVVVDVSNGSFGWWDIVGFQVLGLSEGYCYPWEVEA